VNKSSQPELNEAREIHRGAGSIRRLLAGDSTALQYEILDAHRPLILTAKSADKHWRGRFRNSPASRRV